MSTLTTEQLDSLRSFDTCTISDAIETFDVRLRNEGFATTGFRCLFKGLPPMVGYAATCRIRSSVPPMMGRQFIERTDWLGHLGSIPAPRVVVIQDIDEPPGVGAFLGKVHANLLKALGCVGAVTNGAARELAEIEASGFQVFAGRLAISRAYVHIVEFGMPVEVGGLGVRPGDLIHGDRHGILIVPQAIAALIPPVAARILQKKRQVIGICERPGVSTEELRSAIEELVELTGKSRPNKESPERG